MIASFYEVRRDGSSFKKVFDGPVVKAAISDANFEAQLNWQSAFEQAGPESKAPTLFAMLQSGVIQPIIDGVTGGKSPSQAEGFLQQFEGRTGITKLNSIQVFNGMPPIKIPVTAVFRAWADPQTEVMNPVDQLMEWSLPVELAKDSTMLSNAVQATKGTKDWIEAVLPSVSPVLVAMQYKGRTYSPLVIESIGIPISSPVDATGKFVELSVPLMLCTLTAIDRKDWINIKQGKS